MLSVVSAGTINIEASDNITVTSDAEIKLKAANKITLVSSQIDIKGPVTQTGGDMTSDGISAQNHPHDKVQSGSAKSGGPVKL